MAKKTAELREEKQGLRKIYRKSWPFDNLFGSAKFELDAAQWGIWNWLLDFAKLSRVQPGLIAPAKDQSYTHEWLAAFLNVPQDTFERTIEILKSTNRIKENGSGIEVINWGKYQTEYDRQKPYREAKKEKGKELFKWCRECDYKSEGRTSDIECPQCGARLETDYERGNKR